MISDNNTIFNPMTGYGFNRLLKKFSRTAVQ